MGGENLEGVIPSLPGAIDEPDEPDNKGTKKAHFARHSVHDGGELSPQSTRRSVRDVADDHDGSSRPSMFGRLSINTQPHEEEGTSRSRLSFTPLIRSSFIMRNLGSLPDDPEDRAAYVSKHWTREELLIVGIYVPCYAIVTRLPMIFAVVHMRTVYGLSAGWCAFFFCAYCVGRMLAAYVVQMIFSMKAMAASTCCGLIGFSVILLCQDYWWVFGSQCFILGLSETVTGFDVILKKECQFYKMPAKRQVMTFRFCMITTTIGSGGAYCLGGVLYQNYGAVSVCILGLVSSSIQMLALLVYYCWRSDFINGGFLTPSDEEQSPTQTSVQNRTSHKKTLEKRKKESDEARASLNWKPASQKEQSARERYAMMWTVVASMYITPMPIGTNFATLAYYWLSVWGIGTSTSGALMAAGECLGVFVLLFFQRPCVFNSPITFPFGSPMNICSTSMVLGACSFLVVVPNLYVCAVGSIGVHMFNAAIHSFCNELCAIACPKEQYAEWQGRIYLSKRTSNCTMGFVQTILMSILPGLPFIVTGSIISSWGLILSVFYVSKGLSPLQVRWQQNMIGDVIQRMALLSNEGFEAPVHNDGRRASLSSLAGDRRASVASALFIRSGTKSLARSGTKSLARSGTRSLGRGGTQALARTGTVSLRDVVEDRRQSIDANNAAINTELMKFLPKQHSMKDVLLERMFQKALAAELEEMELEDSEPQTIQPTEQSDRVSEAFESSSDDEPIGNLEEVCEAQPQVSAKDARRMSAMDCCY